MTAKYMFLSVYGDEKKRERFKGCHCPMDGVMIEFFKKGFKKYKGLERFEESTSRQKFMAIDWENAWSKIGREENKTVPDEYNLFKDCIEDIRKMGEGELYPIEVDYMYHDWKKTNG